MEDADEEAEDDEDQEEEEDQEEDEQEEEVEEEAGDQDDDEEDGASDEEEEDEQEDERKEKNLKKGKGGVPPKGGAGNGGGVNGQGMGKKNSLSKSMSKPSTPTSKRKQPAAACTPDKASPVHRMLRKTSMIDEDVVLVSSTVPEKDISLRLQLAEVTGKIQRLSVGTLGPQCSDFQNSVGSVALY